MKPVTDEAGWLHTGDIGQQDAAGNIYFRGRRKDVIVTAAGMKVHPEDLEKALDCQPEIRGSAIVGIEGPHGAEPLAALILHDPLANVEQVIQRANQSLAQHQQLRRWIVWLESDFPRTTTTRKVIRRLVAEVVRERMKSGATDGLTTKPSSFVLQQIARISGQLPAQTAATANLTSDLQLDSLGRVELLAALEDRYQIEIDEAAFTAATTLGEVEKMIHATAPEPVPYPFPAWPQRFPATWIRRLVLYLLLLPLIRLLCPMRVTGQEHLEDLGAPALFISNHITAIDPALILSALPGKWRNRMAIAMIGEFLRDWLHPPAGTNWLKRIRLRVQFVLVAALFNVFPLPQQSGFRRSFAFAGETMDRGYNLMLFPEGGRTRDGRLQPFMRGSGLLAGQLGVPVVPIRIDGLFALTRKRRFFAKPGEVTVRFGKPIEFPDDATAAKITKTLEQLVAEL